MFACCGNPSSVARDDVKASVVPFHYASGRGIRIVAPAPSPPEPRLGPVRGRSPRGGDPESAAVTEAVEMLARPGTPGPMKFRYLPGARRVLTGEPAPSAASSVPPIRLEQSAPGSRRPPGEATGPGRWQTKRFRYVPRAGLRIIPVPAHPLPAEGESQSVWPFQYLPGGRLGTEHRGKVSGATDRRSAAALEARERAARAAEGGRPPGRPDAIGLSAGRRGTPGTGAALLEAVGISKSFGGLRVLHDVSFRVSEGEIVALIGPNGAGKTTLFNVVNGLVKPSKGFIDLAGRRLTSLPPHAISRMGVGRTFQTPRPFLEMSVVENVRTAIRFSRRPREQPKDLLDLLDLDGHADVPARRLTTERRKRLELAMALALQPRILLLDEILGGLTRTEAGQFTTMLRQIRNDRGIAILWIDHVMWAVMETAERAIVLHHGEVISEGDPRSVSRDDRVISAYLGSAAEPRR
jgi:branched-chain amino acid transport system ATP-binding protein